MSQTATSSSRDDHWARRFLPWLFDAGFAPTVILIIGIYMIAYNTSMNHVLQAFVSLALQKVVSLEVCRQWKMPLVRYPASAKIAIPLFPQTAALDAERLFVNGASITATVWRLLHSRCSMLK